MRHSIVFAVMAIFVAALGGCSSIEKKAEEISSRSFSRYAVGRPYANVASLPDYDADTLGRIKMFGDPVGSYRLADGDVVHRHVKQEERSTTSVDFGLIRQSESKSYAVRLSYFRVGPDGMVRDVASGFVPGGKQRCIGYVGGLISKCEDSQALNRTLLEYDSVVRTSSGQPVTSWGPAATNTLVENAPAPIKPLAED